MLAHLAPGRFRPYTDRMQPLSETEILLRIAATFGTAIVIGLERESHGRAAGLRTTAIVALASAMAMILSDSLFIESVPINSTWHPDPARLAAGILTGMGFLGGGVIIKEGNNLIRGVTTASVLWFVTVLGLTFGSGHYFLGVVSWAMALLTLAVLPRLESRIKNDWYGTITIRAGLEGISEDEIGRRLEHHHGLHVKSVSLDYDLKAQQRKMRFDLKYKKKDLLELSQRVIADLRGGSGIEEVKWD